MIFSSFPFGIYLPTSFSSFIPFAIIFRTNLSTDDDKCHGSSSMLHSQIIFYDTIEGTWEVLIRNIS